MSSPSLALFWPYAIFIIMLFIIGLYCILVTSNLIRLLIGVELLMKAVTLLLILVGRLNNHTSLTQAMVITLIVIEVVLITVAMGLVLGLYRDNKNLDTRELKNLKG